MCDFANVQKVVLKGSGKSAGGWFGLQDAQVYHDHFIKAPVEEGVVVDVLDGQAGGVHVCLELDAASARALAEAILGTVQGLEEKRAAVASRLARMS